MEPPAHNQDSEELKADVLPFARSYQLEALEKAMKQNTIVFLETGSGKTLIAIMLLRTFGHLIRKPSPYIAVFLVPTVVLVTQQGEAIKKHTDLKVGKYWGEMGVDFWDACVWSREVGLNEVLILTPAILLSALRHNFLKIEMIKLLIFDECHNARGKHPYSCIMKEFYHRELQSGNVQLPRIFGMTASPLKKKASSSGDSYWEGICALENLMNSKIYTCASESVLAAYISFPTSQVRTYSDIGIPYQMYVSIHDDLHRLKDEYIAKSNLSKSTTKAVGKRLKRLLMTFLYCLVELGVFLASKAAESLSCKDKDIFNWYKLNLHAESVIRGFCLDAAKIISAQMPSVSIGAQSYATSDLQGDMDAGYLTSKVFSLIGILLDYRDIKDLRCIIFVERIVTAIVLPSLLNELLPKLTGWQTKYTAGNGSKLQAQSRTVQNTTVEEFRKGIVNIIVATSILEEGLDVQNCNLVIRFDPSTTVCSFIQSRGRARMQNSQFILLVNCEDVSTLDKVRKYLESGEIMRKESLSHASQPCLPLERDQYDEYSYKVDSTGAIVNLRSSVSLLNLYCSRLPSDRYFKPAPRYDIDNDTNTCTLLLPKSCQIKKVEVEGDVKILKQLACLEACKQLHLVGALTDNLVPEIMEEKEDTQETGCVHYNDKQPKYHPPELIDCHGNDPETVFYCYLIELSQYSYQDTQLQNVILAVKMKLEFSDEKLTFDLNVDGDIKKGRFFYVGQFKLTSEKINRCRMFQVILLSALIHKDLNKLAEALDRSRNVKGFASFDYLLLPSSGSCSNSSVNWSIVDSLCFSSREYKRNHTNCLSVHDYSPVHTKTGLVCSCRLKSSLICTPHNGSLYHITDILHTSNGNSTLKMRKGKSVSYKDYFREGHGIDLVYEGEALLNGKFMPTVQNYLKKSSARKSSAQKAPRNLSVELPPELCSVIMSPITYDVLCSFTFVPSIMHRIESLLLALNLKRLHMDHCTQNVNVPIFKILEATTTKKCLETFHLESLETLGDSFLKYAVGQQLFTTYQNAHEGLLSLKKEKMVSNATLCKLACSRNIPGFIRTEPFDPKTWLVPGDHYPDKNFDVESVSPSRKIYSMECRKMKGKRVADAVEALIGAYVSTAGEPAALSFMAWLGLDIHYDVSVPMTRCFPISADNFVNVEYLEDLLKYKFSDPSLLVEALTHGSFMQSDIPRCYQRLEFIGDAVLDYIITVHLYAKHPGLTPGLLTDLRSCSVNNDCYALCAVKADLHKQVLYFSTDLQKHITDTVERVEKLRVSSTFGWESEISFPKVLGDIIESLAGAILVDSGFNKDKVYESIIPLLEPMVTPETLTLHPVRELYELCLSRNYKMKKPRVTLENGIATFTMEVEDANGVIHSDSCTAPNKVAAKKLSCQNLLKKLRSMKG